MVRFLVTDQRRMNEIIMYLTKLRCNAEKMDKLRQKEVTKQMRQ